ncbi:hypothetical protein Y032_0013g1934 [Ancylostoma ceylanicum]|uniref:Uncharacterized protein n=1 Tax=Ancylostoma ceylanicum TaxID=53326 RepID=A0A016VB75_9BILA|nr:hypothetical protein Y032_0013g1934 [Ancylostoma ceylanicum]
MSAGVHTTGASRVVVSFILDVSQCCGLLQPRIWSASSGFGVDPASIIEMKHYVNFESNLVEIAELSKQVLESKNVHYDADDDLR